MTKLTENLTNQANQDLIANYESGSFLASLVSSKPYKIVFSGPTSSETKYRKITLSIYERGYLCEQLTEKQAFHLNVPKKELKSFIEKTFPDYTQLNAFSNDFEFSAKKSKKGKLLTNKRSVKAEIELDKSTSSHNRKKNYLLPEGEIIAPLVDMGVTDASGKVHKQMSDKFKQINRYLEIIDDLIRKKDLKEINIIDFGCGKSYLTFIVYYYFTQIRNIDITMTGVDLKEDVIEFCNELAKKYDYKNLHFVVGDIAKFDTSKKVDMVISLHACDTATDYALYNAIKWNSEYIFAVPCCQHEVFKQADYYSLPIIDDFGIVKERVSALLTDSIRANVLTALGYKTQLLEFVDLSHTPKNILIRALKTNLPGKTRNEAIENIKTTCEQFKILPTLVKLLDFSNSIR